MDWPKLTDHFSLEEFIVSKSYPEISATMRKDVEFNTSHAAQKNFENKCFYLARMFLEPLRQAYNEPIEILSGLRSDELNKLVKGSDTTDHRFLGETGACDFTMTSIDSAANMLATSTWPYGQMIWYPENRFIHVSLPSRKHFRSILKKVGGVYYPFFQEVVR